MWKLAEKSICILERSRISPVRKFGFASIPRFEYGIYQAADILPVDSTQGTLVGRCWVTNEFDPSLSGPSVVAITNEGVWNLTEKFSRNFGETKVCTTWFPTLTHLLRQEKPVHAVREALKERISHQKSLSKNLQSNATTFFVGTIENILKNTFKWGQTSTADRTRGVYDEMSHFISPADTQAIKAAGVTFVNSMIERVIEEQAKGDPAKADSLRRSLSSEIGLQLSSIKPASQESRLLKDHLVKRGLWSQYLEVGLGEDAEIFTKSQPMSSVGLGFPVGVHPKSTWSNPEPELVLVVSPKGQILGVTLGNDVNLRDFEGRSALLLGKAKDNNASCAIGPFIRLFDESYTIEDAKNSEISLKIEGKADNFGLSGSSSVKEISRDITELVSQTMGKTHQYPDGMFLFTGTMFSPVEDRDKNHPGLGFTHKVGDIVTISSAKLGSLINMVHYCDSIIPWTYGITSLFESLRRRNLL